VPPNGAPFFPPPQAMTTCSFGRFPLDDVILVDAAHLSPFAESQDDSPPNGMALRKNHRRLMDRYLIAPGPGRGGEFSKPVWLVSPLLDDRLVENPATPRQKDAQDQGAGVKLVK